MPTSNPTPSTRVLGRLGAALVFFGASAAGPAATMEWTNAAGGFWNVPVNWSPNTVPGAGDTANITRTGTYTVILNGGVTIDGLTLGGAAGVQTLAMNNQLLQLRGPFVVNPHGAYALDNGALAGVSNAVLTGTFHWAAGALAGTLTLAAGSTLSIDGAGADHEMPNCILTNFGTVAWSAGRIRGGGSGLNPGTSIFNHGLWDAQADLAMNNDFGGNATVFNNRGIFRKSGGAGVGATYTLMTAGVQFNQLAGVVDVQNGTNGLELVLQGGGTFTGGHITTNTSGFTVLSAGSFNLNGTATPTNLIENAGNLVGPTTIQGALTWQAGNWNGAGQVTLTAGSTLLISGPADHDLANCVFTNRGTVLWISGRLRGGGGSLNPGTTYQNFGVWDTQGDWAINNDYGANGSVFNNHATFRKSGGAGIGSTYTLFTAGVQFNQPAGVLDVQNGTNGLELVLQGGGTLTGGHITTNADGVTILSAGNFNLNGTVTPTNLIENAAHLVGTTTIQGALTWQAGTWNGVGQATVTAGSTLLIESGADHDLANCIFVNHGTVRWTDGRIRGGGAGHNPGTTIQNHGLWDIVGDLTINNDYGANACVFVNDGVLRKSAGRNSGQAVLTGGVFLQQPAGQLNVLTGSLVLQGGGQLTGGAVSGPGLTVFSGGNFNLNGTTTPLDTTIETTGNLFGHVVINGGLQWQGGLWSGANSVTIASNSTVVMDGGQANLILFNLPVTNFGTVTWLSGHPDGGGAIQNPGTEIHNHGVWDCRSDSNFKDDGGGNHTVFHNHAILRKSGGASSSQTVFQGGVYLDQAAGRVEVQQGNLVLQGGGSFTGGAVDGPGHTVFSAGTFNLNGTTTPLESTFENAGHLVGHNVIQGGLQWIAGQWAGANSVTIASNSTVVLAGGDANMLLFNLPLTNHGTVTWLSGYPDGGGSTFNPGTQIHNYGLWDCQSDYNFKDDGGGNHVVFYNHSVLRKSGGAASRQTLFQGGVFLHHVAGRVEVTQGNLVLQGGGDFLGGAVTGPGLTVLSAGGFNLNGATTPLASTIETGGALIGHNVIRGGLQWIGGQWSGADSVTIANAGTVHLAGGDANMIIYNLPITNYGTFTWTSGYPDGGGSFGTTIYNYGLWSCQGDFVWKNDGGGNGTVFNNYGTFRKESSTGATIMTPATTFNNTGTLEAESGLIALQGPATFADGTQMSFGITSTTGYGQIALPGPAAFTGAVRARFNDIFYWPPVGTTFNLLTYASAGAPLFTNTALPAFISWTTNYGANTYSISVASRSTNSVPSSLYASPLDPESVLIRWPGDHTGWLLQSQTNPLTVGLTRNWTTVSASGLTNQIRITVDPSLGTVFYRMASPSQ